VVCTVTPTAPCSTLNTVVVVAGEHDGREDYGISFAQAARAPVVVCRIPKEDGDAVVARVCSQAIPGCTRFAPLPFTANDQRRGGDGPLHGRRAGWSKIIVVTWRRHPPRARLVFRQCLSDASGSVITATVPHSYHYSAATRRRAGGDLRLPVHCFVEGDAANRLQIISSLASELLTRVR
jgi:hypothetical protein